jgi:hypothetical protein
LGLALPTHQTPSLHLHTTTTNYPFFKMYSMNQHSKPMATAAAAGPGLLTQVGMAGTAAVITVSFIHPLDVIKVCRFAMLSVFRPN